MNHYRILGDHAPAVPTPRRGPHGRPLFVRATTLALVGCLAWIGGVQPAFGQSAGPTEATQSTNVNVVQRQILSISLAQTSVTFGTLEQGSTPTVPTGDIYYTNTLNNTNAWSSTVRATSLVKSDSSDNIYFNHLGFTPGQTVAPSGPEPGGYSVFNGTDTTPGVTLSQPVTLVTAGGSHRGSYTQSGSSIFLNLPPNQSPGTYNGTLQYTVLG